MGRKTTKQFINRGKVLSVIKHGKFIFALKGNGVTDIYLKKKRSCKVLIASEVVEFYHKSGYLFFKCKSSQQEGWSCVKESSFKVLRLGEAVDHFFVLQQRDSSYTISFFDEKGEIERHLSCSNYFFDKDKGLLVTEENGYKPRLWERKNIWKRRSMTMMSSDTKCFILRVWQASVYEGFMPVYILRDAKGVEWAFVPCPPYYAGGVRKLRKADNHLRKLCEKNRPYRRTLKELWLILKNKMFH